MRELFEFSMSPVELFLRGTLVYLGLILVVRFILRRDVGALGTADLLFILLVADASQNAMAGEYKTLADGAVLLATLVLWNAGLDWLAYHSPAFRSVLEPPPRPLVENGQILRRNLKKDWITLEELQYKLREQGISDMATVRLATLEPDGELSVLRMDSTPVSKPKRKRPG